METTARFPLSGAESDSRSSFKMIDVGGKTPTRRRAVARGTILLSRDAFVALRDKKNPKGDVLCLAEVAGIQAVKRVPDAIPLCHSLPIEYARLRFEMSEERNEVTAYCEVGTTGKTGVEMEALAGVNGALLTIYDLSKAVNPVLSMYGIRLDVKEGGKSGRWTHPDFFEADSSSEKASEPHATPSRTWQSDLSEYAASVLVVSDRCSRGETEDRSGIHLEDFFRTQKAKLSAKKILPDEIEVIREHVAKICHHQKVQLLFVTGGTGISPRDMTPEALAPLWTKKIPGIGELLRSSGSQHTNMSWISRSEAGLVGRTLVVLLPGSENAVKQALTVLDPILNHTLQVIQGGNHEKTRF